MNCITLEKENLKEFLSKLKYLKHGGNGIIFQYNEEELIKLFYKNYFDTYDDNVLDKIVTEIFETLEIKKIKDYLFFSKKSKEEKIITLIKKLNNTNTSTLYKGTIQVESHIIATILNNYHNYVELSELYNELTLKNKKEVLEKIIVLLDELATKGIYPTDLKLENIMINKNTLDVKLIDLDDNTTMITNIDNDFYKCEVAKRLLNIRKKIING